MYVCMYVRQIPISRNAHTYVLRRISRRKYADRLIDYYETSNYNLFAREKFSFVLSFIVEDDIFFHRSFFPPPRTVRFSLSFKSTEF